MTSAYYYQKSFLFGKAWLVKIYYKTTFLVPLMLLLCCSYVALIPEKSKKDIRNGFLGESQSQ